MVGDIFVDEEAALIDSSVGLAVSHLSGSTVQTLGTNPSQNPSQDPILDSDQTTPKFTTQVNQKVLKEVPSQLSSQQSTPGRSGLTSTTSSKEFPPGWTNSLMSADDERLFEELMFLDPQILTDDELQKWMHLIETRNESLRNEIWCFEKFWKRNLHQEESHNVPAGTIPEGTRAHVSLVSGGSFQAYEEIVKGKSKATATFQDFMEIQQDRASNPAHMSSVSTVKSFTSKKSSAFGSKASSLSGSSSQTHHEMAWDDKNEVAMLEVRNLKDERIKRHHREENALQVIKNNIEQHKEHLQDIERIKRIFRREVLFGGVCKTKRIEGEAVVKFYDDVIRHDNHMMELAALSSINMKKRETNIVKALKAREEMGDNFSTIDFQQLEIENQAAEAEHRGVVDAICRLKSKQGECNFHYNSWNKKLEEESRQQQKLQREIQSIKNVVSHLDAEIATVSATLKIHEGQNRSFEKLLDDFHQPDTIDYVRQVGIVQTLEAEVAAWERRVQLDVFTQRELKHVLDQELTKSGRREEKNKRAEDQFILIRK